MKALVVYDSVHGNTAKVARAIGEAIGGRFLQVGDANPADLEGVDLLIVGSPTALTGARHESTYLTPLLISTR